MKLNKKILLVFLIVAALIYSGAIAFAAQSSDIDKEVAAEEARMKELERKIEEHRRKAQQIGSQERSVLGELSKLEQNTAILQQQNKVISLKTQKLRNDIDKLNNDIRNTRGKIDQIVVQLKLRMINMSRYGDAENLNLFFSSESTHDVMNSIYLLEKLSLHDQNLIEELMSQEKLLLENNSRLTKNKEELTSESEKLKSKQLEYNNAIAATNKFLGDVRKQKSLQEQAARDAEAAQREIGKTIADLRKRKMDRPPGEGSQSSKDYTYLATGSMLDWPVSGKIASSFGSRVHPVFKTKSTHSGIDIAANAGTPVTAAGPGEVLYAGWQRGFGQVIIIDHGRDISTVYAHLDAMYVNDGDAVKSGTKIGAVGKTGTTTGYHLHFEVRVGAEAKDPLRYLKKR
ncbi:MAG: peptidoglycan DD-metalloendopeptidase family protein [Synergistaceae bacterium]|nr:peptidoglycan DD-metalloendopeptidase family protein [Synergistaceae bacterium]